MPTRYENKLLADGAVLLWPLHEPAGSSTVTDLSPTNFTGTVVPGGTTLGVVDPPAVLGSPGTVAQGLDVTGSGIGSNDSGITPTNFTMEIWVEPQTTTANHAESNSGTAGLSGNPEWVIYPTHNTANAGLGVAVGTDRVVVYGHGDAFIPALLNHAVSLTTWTHVVVVVTNNVPSLYINGVFARTGLAPGGRTAYGSRYIGTGPYGGFSGRYASYSLYPTALTAQQVADHYTLGSTPSLSTSIFSASAYGTRSYGGGAIVSSGVVQTNTSAGRSTMTAGMTVYSGTGRMSLYESEPNPEDITLATVYGPDTLHSVSSGQAGGTANESQSFNIPSTSSGQAGGSWGMGQQHPVSSTSAGQAGATKNEPLILPPVHQGDIVVRDSAPDPGDIAVGPDTPDNSFSTGSAGAATVTMGMSLVASAQSTSAGVATVSALQGYRLELAMTTAGRGGIDPNRMFVILRENYFTIYPSKPPYDEADVLLATPNGPGEQESMLLYVNGVGSMTANMGVAYRVQSTSSGVATMTPDQRTNFAIASTSNGRAAFANNYMGSPIRMEATSAGRGGARDQFGTAGKWYLGSSTRMAATSNGRAGCNNNYLASRVPMTVTSAGRAGCVNNYLSSRIFFAMTSAGRATSTMYLASRIYFTTTMAGRAGGTNYLSSPARFLTTSNGRATVVAYMGSPVYWFFGSWFSNGRGGGQNYLSDEFDLPSITSNGRSANTAYIAGLVQLNSRAINGVATASMQPHRGPQHFGPGSITARGVATFFIDPGLLYMTSNGRGIMNNIPRPSEVFMQWGLGEFFYERHFPYIEPLLIPKGSNGMSFMQVEIDTIPIMHHHADGVSDNSATMAGIERISRMQTITGGSFDWTVFGEDAEAGLVGTRRPWFGSVGALNVAGTQPVYIRQNAARDNLGITMTLTPVPVVWNPRGIATVGMFPTINFYRRWQTWTDEEPFFPVRNPPYGGPHFFPNSSGTRRAGGVGTMSFRGPRQVEGLAQARAGGIWRLNGLFANVVPVNGVATAVLLDEGNFVLLYGDMLAQNFSISLPLYGQIWPRRILRADGLPV